MKNVIFKNEKSFLGRLESFAWKLWESPFVRFIVVGGFNTVIGVGFTILVRELFTLMVLNPKWLIWGFEGDWPVTLNYVLLFPLAYTTQALFSFRTQWRWTRFWLYPLSTIPNYLLNLGFTYVFETLLGWPSSIAYALSAVLPIPIMFVIIRLMVVKPSSNR